MVLFVIVIMIFLLPLLCLSSIVLRIVIGFALRYIKGSSRLLGLQASTMDEDYVNSNPRSNLVSTLELDGDLSLESFINLFQEKVLNAKFSNGDGKEVVKYPELKQYRTNFLGFPMWKNESNFDIRAHITENPDSNGNDGFSLDLAKLHQDLLNKKYGAKMSPWEVILIRNAIMVDKNKTFTEESKEKARKNTVLAYRMHHIMGDALSILKIFVECVGGKSLESASARSNNMSATRKLLFPILLPINFLLELKSLCTLLFKSYLHPWCAPYSTPEGKLFVKFSHVMEVKRMKQVAQESDVTLSAVLIAIIAGGIRRFNPSLAKTGIPLAYILPKENHPKILANHCRAGDDVLPTNQESISDRLRQCETIFKSMRRPERYISIQTFAYALGSLPKGILKSLFCRNYYTAVGITNIAGEREPFSVGNCPCTGFRMSVGGLQGCAGVVFCALSHGHDIRVAVIGTESVVSENEVELIARSITLEYDAIVGTLGPLH